MLPDERIAGLHPQVAFSLDTIYGVMGWGTYDVGPAEAAIQLTVDVVTESLEQVTGVSAPEAIKPEEHSLYPAAGAGAVLFSLDQARSWLGTAADLAQLGAIALLIVDKLCQRSGRQDRIAVFSQEMVEGMCVRSLQQRLDLDLGQVWSCSHAFDRWWGQATAGEPPGGAEIYLVWVRTADDAYLFLVDCQGEVWFEHRVTG